MLASPNKNSLYNFSKYLMGYDTKKFSSSTSLAITTKKTWHSSSLSPNPHHFHIVSSCSSGSSNLFSSQDPWAELYRAQNYEDGEEKEKPGWDCLKSLVLVSCTSAKPDVVCPWKITKQDSKSSGFIIEGRRVLTCAHSVEYHAEVKLKPHNSNTWYTATVLSVAPECDLAMLTVGDGEFWNEVEPVEFFWGMPSFRNELTILGYAFGRLTVSVIPGSDAMVKMTRYYPCFTKLMAIWVNARTECGNSGGPVFNERGKCVGVLFQGTFFTSDVIAAPVINHFIEDYDKNGAYTGFPSLGVVWQKMENPDLRLSMKMGPNKQGVLITGVKPNYPESEILRPYDVILSIDGINIDNDGTVPFGEGERIDFTSLIAEKYKGNKITIAVLRDSKTYEFVVELSTYKQFKPTYNGRPHSYYVVGGFVFITLCPRYLRYVYDNADKDIEDDKDIEEEGILKALYEEEVIVSKVLKDEINSGYDEGEIEGYQVLTFNGKPVHGLQDLVIMVESCNEEFLEFILENHKMIVLCTKSARARNREILKIHGIPSTISDDLNPSL